MKSHSGGVLILICHQFFISSCKRTSSAPDEIIQILTSGTYNKHHLPSYHSLIGHVNNLSQVVSNGSWNLTMSCNADISGEFHILLTEVSYRYGFLRNTSLALTFRMAENLMEYVKATAQKYNTTEYHVDVSATVPQVLAAESFFNNDGTNVTIRLFVDISMGLQYQINSILLPFDLAQNFCQRLAVVLVCETAIEQENPTVVTIGIYIESMSSFRAQTMDFHLDIYLSEIWQDERLKHSSTMPSLIRSQDIFEKMWHPDLYFANAKTAAFHSVTRPNFLVWVWPNGTINYDTRVSLTADCMMVLSNYPLDSQDCNVRILSFLWNDADVTLQFIDTDAYNNETLLVKWKEAAAPININPEIRLPDMSLVAYTAEYCTAEYDIAVWSCAVARFKMKREVMHHILQSYVPTALIVVISWFSFWLDVEAVPGRVSLSITTLLTLATHASAARMALPQVAYAKAIDVWMGMCMSFVFSVMIEFTLVNYVGRKFPPAPTSVDVNSMGLESDKNGDSICQKESAGLILSAECESCKNIVNHFTLEELSKPKPPRYRLHFERTKLNRSQAEKIDKACRVIFPMTFLLFNLIYWPYYLHSA